MPVRLDTHWMRRLVNSVGLGPISQLLPFVAIVINEAFNKESDFSVDLCDFVSFDCNNRLEALVMTTWGQGGCYQCNFLKSNKTILYSKIVTLFFEICEKLLSNTAARDKVLMVKQEVS